MSRILRTVVALTLLLFLVVGAAAQLQSGNIYGTVTDEQGEPLPGVTVTLTGPGAPQVQVTNGRGDFRFLDLSPSSYQLTAELEGFAAVNYPNVNVNVGRNTTIEITLSSTGG